MVRCVLCVVLCVALCAALRVPALGMFLIPGAGHVRRESLDVNLAPRHRRVHEFVPCIQCGSSAGVWVITAWARTLRERS